MRKEDALKILAAKLVEIEQEHDQEIEGNEERREAVDVKAEARALTAIFDFLQNSRIAPSESLLRVFRRYLRTAKTHAPVAEQRRPPRSRAS
jgi:hypothetical protein